MKRSMFMLTTTAILLAATAASAQEGWYVDGHGGANLVHRDKAAVAGAGIKQSTEHDWGWAGGAAVGYDYGNGLRNEIEATYRTNDLNEISNASATGDTSSWAFMYNAIYGFDVAKGSGFTPYLGAGVGAVRTQVDQRSFSGGRSIDDSSLDLGVQGIAGVQYDVDDNLGVYADYRYLTAFGTEYKDSLGSSVKTDYDNSTVMVGLRYSFGAPAPVAAPIEPVAAPVAAMAPQPAPAAPSPVSRKYLVFFDFNKAILTPEAVDVIKQAAADAVAGNSVSLDISGHADRSGTDSYNQRLSAKRAASVKEQLKRLGINPAAVTTSALGESQPLVPTDDGVKEPQNRRAEITYVIQPR
jgi:OmpA-OmpF porin, OOP family